MVIYYEGTTPAGYWLYTGSDKLIWKNIVTGNDLLSPFKSMQPWPSLEQATRLKTSLKIV